MPCYGYSALGEFLGGILLGLFTRVGAFLICCAMLTGIIGIHWPPFFLDQGFEYAMTLLSVALSLFITGGGRLSIDQLINKQTSR